MVTRRYVSTRLIQPGDVIDQSIIDSTGRILVARKSVLDQYVIQSLRNMGIRGIYIRQGEEEPEDEDLTISPEIQQKIDKMQVPDRAKMKLTESVKKRVESGISFLFHDTNSSSFVETANAVSNDLMKAILSNDAVAVDVATLKVSDEYTFKHSVDVASIAMVIAKQSGLAQKDVYQIGMAGLLHDLGKSEIPTEILNKPAKLTDEEFRIMKQHSLYGYQILKEKKDVPLPVLAGVLQHHEKCNGRGYPLGVKADQISMYAKILSVADIYDALVTERPYKKGFSPRDAVEMIMAMTGELDTQFIRDFLKSVILYPIGSIVQLSNGEKAKVVQNYTDYPTRPKVVGIKSGITYNLGEDLKCSNIIIE